MSDLLVRDGYYRGFVIGLMKLLSIHSFSATRAYRLELFYLEEDRTLSARIFESVPVFNRVSNLKVGKNYVVVGWLTPTNNIIEVVDIN